VIATKAVYSPIEISKEGLRILVTRLQGRGLPASRYDVWMANLGPIERLLAAVRSQGISGGKIRPALPRGIAGRWKYRSAQPIDHEPRAEVHSAPASSARAKRHRQVDVSLC
jgi:hypothetical protein